MGACGREIRTAGSRVTDVMRLGQVIMRVLFMWKTQLSGGLVLLVCLAANAAFAGEKPYFDGKQSLYRNAPPNEIAALPKYCWGHYMQKFKGPKFNIQREQCGVRHNHFCQGLLQFNRSQHPMASKLERRHYLKSAIDNFEYTIQGVKDFPACPVRRHAQLIHRRAVTLRAQQAMMLK